jgi:hypothetical protein
MNFTIPIKNGWQRWEGTADRQQGKLKGYFVFQSQAPILRPGLQDAFRSQVCITERLMMNWHELKEMAMAPAF